MRVLLTSRNTPGGTELAFSLGKFVYYVPSVPNESSIEVDRIDGSEIGGEERKIQGIVRMELGDCEDVNAGKRIGEVYDGRCEGING